MALELVLLVSFVGMAMISTIGNPNSGLRAQFEQSGPILAGRMERRMATGRCMQTPVGGAGLQCDSILFSSKAVKE
jgi:Flp pilus assembly pilin Flp